MEGSFTLWLLLAGVLLVVIWQNQHLLLPRHVERFQTVQASIQTPNAEQPGHVGLKPTLWWFVDDEANSRVWWDFGARNSREPNRGYLQVALESVLATQAFDFNVTVLLGREAVATVLREAGVKVPVYCGQIPVTLWRQWALANLLAAKGGLVMVGDSTLCVGPSFGPSVFNKEAAVFGMTADVDRAVPGSDVPPAPWVGWAAKPHTAPWDVAATTWTHLVEAGPTSWSAAEARRIHGTVWEAQRGKGIALLQAEEGSRRADGMERTLEDFFMKVSSPADPKIALAPQVLYVPVEGDALVRNRRYAWFVRMSKEQILTSNFGWAELAKKHRVRLFKSV